jgi:hypothetical protein
MAAELGIVTQTEVNEAQEPTTRTVGELLKEIHTLQIERRMNLPTKSLVFGVQEYPVRSNEYQSEFNSKSIDEIANILKSNPAEIGPVTVVIIQGSPIVLDGHHRVRAHGKKGISQVACNIVSSDQVLNYLGCDNIENGLQVIIDCVNRAKSTYREYLEEKKIRKNLDYVQFTKNILESRIRMEERITPENLDMLIVIDNYISQNINEIREYLDGKDLDQLITAAKESGLKGVEYYGLIEQVYQDTYSGIEGASYLNAKETVDNWVRTRVWGT